MSHERNLNMLLGRIPKDLLLLSETSQVPVTFAGETRQLSLTYSNPEKVRRMIEAIVTLGFTDTIYGGITRRLDPKQAELVAQNAIVTLRTTATQLGSRTADVTELFIPFRSSVYLGVPRPGSDIDVSVVVRDAEAVKPVASLLADPAVMKVISMTIRHPWLSDAHFMVNTGSQFVEGRTQPQVLTRIYRQK